MLAPDTFRSSYTTAKMALCATGEESGPQFCGKKNIPWETGPCGISTLQLLHMHMRSSILRILTDRISPTAE